MKKLVYCSLQIEGVHFWGTCDKEEVDYLRAYHRHMWYIKAYTEVGHSDRDVEFIMMKHQITDYLNNKYYDNRLKCCDFGSQSCEMIGEELIKQFNLHHVIISEDNENGSEVYADEIIR